MTLPDLPAGMGAFAVDYQKTSAASLGDVGCGGVISFLIATGVISALSSLAALLLIRFDQFPAYRVLIGFVSACATFFFSFLAVVWFIIWFATKDCGEAKCVPGWGWFVSLLGVFLAGGGLFFWKKIRSEGGGGGKKLLQSNV